MIQLCFVLFSFVCYQSNGYPTGADPSVCTDFNMKPGHNNHFQNSISPYFLRINTCDFSNCSVTIEGIDYFMGILLRAVDINNNFVGKFYNVVSSTKLICGGSALTHNVILSINKLQAGWIIGNLTGPIYFRATIVKNYNTFWNIKSEMRYINDSSLSRSDSFTMTPRLISTNSNYENSLPWDYSISGFDNTNASKFNYWTFPRSLSTFWTIENSTSLTNERNFTINHIKNCPNDVNCLPCSASIGLLCSITWSEGQFNYVNFQISAQAGNDDRYIAIAFSLDNQMGDDSIIICSRSENTYVAEIWYSVGKSIKKANNPLESLDPNNVVGLYSEGWMSCKFSKEIKPQNSKRDDNLVYYLNGQLYYLLFASGDISEGVPDHHNKRMFSTSSINFTNFKSSLYSSTASNSLIKAHGILMTIAWLMIASFTILLPRYFKIAWPDTKILKKPLWFLGHQTLMVLVFILTAIAFIIIFCKAQGYSWSDSSVAMAHPPVGIIVMILVFINPIMALFRCNPDHKHRWIFNFFHSLVGEFVLVLAVINIFLGFYIPQANIGDWVKWVMVALICWHVFIELLLVMQAKYLQTPSKIRRKVSSGYEFEEPRKSPNKNISIIKSILVVSQWIGVTSLAIVICVGIGRA